MHKVAFDSKNLKSRKFNSNIVTYMKLRQVASYIVLQSYFRVQFGSIIFIKYNKKGKDLL